MSFVIVQTLLILVWLLAILWSPSPHLLPSNGFLDALGTVFCVLGLVVAVAAFLALGASFRVSPTPHEHATLVTRGVYRVLRHPMYTSVVSLAVGVFLWRSSWAVGLLGLVLVIFYHLKAQHEERLLRLRYPEYADYRRRTHGIVPWMKRQDHARNNR